MARLTIPSPPQTQGLSSKTFCPPPLDGSILFGQIFEWHEQHSPHHRLFIYADDTGRIQDITWSDAARAIRAGAQLARECVPWKQEMGKAPIIGILAASDSIPYATMVMGIVRAGYVAFVISVRNSPAAVAHLLNNVGVNHVLVGREQASQDLIQEAIVMLRSQYSNAGIPSVSAMPVYEDLYSPLSVPSLADELPCSLLSLDAPALILHSSGSTAFPKPIIYTNRRVLELGTTPYYGELDITGLIFSTHMMPMFHGMGIMHVILGASCGATVAAFAPKSPPAAPTAETVFQGAKACGCDIIIVTPAFVESWSRNPEYVTWLATLKFLWFGGGPLNKEVGDFLHSQGVSLCIGYGLTEAGCISLFIPARSHPDWEYIPFNPAITAHMLPQGDGTFELIVVASERDHPCLINTQVDGVDAYSTSDRLVPHPSLPGYWKIVGRTDDQIMHSTGEKASIVCVSNALIN
ncbi:uncharacterized protein FIBRA_08792 [Fibroporia radiculosa]|uniref:AMP-dependent synthetase/ligase domain-containing protein n=1 Tax=Fibroporia radiculosa TaxID=599839 RepID=J4GXF2_9APHY|nr:uncharacterized protein FIBRA_08792 [Fibroporia radiculosa]CCM06520.1 predicted protein [Fibroporia radiculosa]